MNWSNRYLLRSLGTYQYQGKDAQERKDVLLLKLLLLLLGMRLECGKERKRKCWLRRRGRAVGRRVSVKYLTWL